MTDSEGVTAAPRERGFEDARVGLHVAVFKRGHGNREETSQFKVGLERSQAAVGIRDQADLETRCVQRTQHVRHLIIQGEVTAGRPLVVDLASDDVDGGAMPTHALDDALRVIDVELRIIEIVASMKARCGTGHGAIERRRIHLDAVSRAELLITRGLEAGTGINQGEINVEEDRARLAAIAHG